MRHIKNSDRDGIFILVHQGIPNSIVTEYGEDISEGSLCVDSTNKDLYILKNNVWQKYGVGFNASDFIPLPGTAFNKPVTGNIEISDNVALVNNSSKLIFNSVFLKLESANSSFLVNDNIIYSNKNSVIVNNTSKFNFVTSLFNNNMVINNSGNNKVFMSCLNGDFSIDNSNNNTINGFNGGAYINYSSNNNSIFNIVYNSNTNDDIYITNNLYSDISAILVPGNTVFITDNTRLVLGGYMENSSVTILTESFIQGNVYGSFISTSNNLRIYGDISNSNFNQTTQNTIIGSYINNVTFSQNGSNFIGSGYMNEVDISQSQSSLYLGYLWKINLFRSTESVLINVSNYDFYQSGKNFVVNSFSSDTSFQSVVKGTDNVYFNIGNIQSTLEPTNNIVFFTSEITYVGANKDNIILSRGFKGTIGSNNFITRIGDTPSNSVFGSYNFMFGDISNTSLTNYGNKNIILGTVNLDSTLTNKNVIIGARNVTGINHNNQEENVFINVGNMLVTDTKSVYLPGRIHLVTDNGYDAKIDTVNLSKNNTYLLQDRSGTIALLDDISGSGGDYIKIDGTSVTTAMIPFIQGLQSFTDIRVNGWTIGRGVGNNPTNLIFGNSSLQSNISSTNNIAIGVNSSAYITTGSFNIGIGNSALYQMQISACNTAIGHESLMNTLNTSNTAVGYRAGKVNGEGYQNTFIGAMSDTTVSTISNATAIGYGALVSADNTIQLGNDIIQNVKTSGTLTLGAITLPNTDGANGQVLTTNGAGVISWGSGISYAGFADINSYDTTKAVTASNLPRVVAESFITNGDNPDNLDIDFDGSIVDISEEAAIFGTPYRKSKIKISTAFRTWLNNRLFERPKPAAATSVAVAYVLYNATNNADANTSVAIKGDGSILRPYCSLHYALTQLGGSSTSTNFALQKSIIVLDSGQVEVLPNTASYNWEKSITLSKGVRVFASNGSTSDAGVADRTIDPTTFLFTGQSGFSLNGGGTIGVWNKGLLYVSGDCEIDNITILYNVIPIKKQVVLTLKIDKCNFYHSVDIDVVNTTNEYSGYINVAIGFPSVCNLTTLTSNYARMIISRCTITNTILTVSVSSGYGGISDSIFYAVNRTVFSFITFQSCESLGYNFTSRNNTYDLWSLDSGYRTAFKSNLTTTGTPTDFGVSINDRIVRISAGQPDMVGTANTLYCYNLATSSSLHNSVPKASASTFLVTVTGLAIA